LVAGVETLAQNTGERINPSSDAPDNNDHVRQQANALLDRHSCRAPSAGDQHGHLEVGDINHLIANCAPATTLAQGRVAGDGPARGDRANDHGKSPVSDQIHYEPPFAPTRDRLVALATEKLGNDPTALAAFQRDMGDFEKRMMAASPIEVQQTYTQLARILDGPSTIVSDDDRIKLAQQVLHEAAHPDKDISQGLSDTCVAASLESRAYTRNPSAAAKMVADIALTGTFITADGRTITPATGISHPYLNDGIDQPGRNFAEQIFQVTTMNIYADMLTQIGDPPGRYRYAITPSADKSLPFEEHLFNDATNADLPFLGVVNDEKVVANLYYRITGVSDPNLMISGSGMQSLADVKNKMNQAMRSGQFPLVLSIFPDVDPIEKEFEEWKNGPLGQQFQKDHPGLEITSNWTHHAITIQSYDPKTGNVTYLDPTLSHETHQTDINTLAEGMGVTLWPETEDRYFDYQKTLTKENGEYSPESKDRYLATIPPAERQEEFNKLITMHLLYDDDLTDAQMAALGLHKTPSTWRGQ